MHDFEMALHQEYERLIGLCTHLTGDADEAEDVAQETLIEAWRNRHKLVDMSGISPWLAAIARNVYLRWRSRRSRQRVLVARVGQAGEPAVDFELDLEQHEMAHLLHEALALLPTETRDVLVARFIESLSPAEIAARMGISQSNVTLRLHRGRGALVERLRGDFGAELEALNDVWQPTSLWCSTCGKHKLVGKLNSVRGKLYLRCPDCYAQRGDQFNMTDALPQVIGGVKGYKAAFTRISRWADSYYLPGVHAGVTDCTNCGQPVYPVVWYDEDSEDYRIDASCLPCGCMNYSTLSGVTFSRPEGQRFWREHGQIQRLPLEHRDEVDGEPAVIVTYESLENGRRLTSVFGLNSYRFLSLEEK